jgi:hypothetical protein
MGGHENGNGCESEIGCGSAKGSDKSRPLPRNIFGVHTATLHPDGAETPWKVKEWEVVNDDPGTEYLALGPEDDTGEMRYRVAAQVTDLDSAAGEPGCLGKVSVVKAPDMMAPKDLERVIETCCRFPLEELSEGTRRLALYQALLDYGLCAPVYQCAGFWEKPGETWTPKYRLFNGGDAKKKAWDWTKGRVEEEAAQVYGLLGFYLDRELNRLGATGWDLLDGRIWGKLGRGKEGRCS